MANDRLPIRILSIANTLPILEVLIPINMYNPVSFVAALKESIGMPHKRSLYKLEQIQTLHLLLQQIGAFQLVERTFHCTV